LIATVVNAYVLHVQYHDLDKKKYALIDFVRELITDLSSSGISSDQLQATMPIKHKRRDAWESDLTRLQLGNHWPKIDTDAESTQHKKEHRLSNRNRCVICRDKTAVYCTLCGAMLCIKSGVGASTCWIRFHSDKEFPELAVGMKV